MTLALAGAVAGGAAGFLLALSYYGAHRVLTGNGRVPLTVRPQTLGLPFEAVACRTADGLTLKGWFVPAAAPSDKTILLCHGWGTNKGAILAGTAGLRERGFNLLYFDFRCCGESEGELLSVGHLEARDFDAATEFLRRHRPSDRYAVYGLSMGAMVAFCGAARHACFEAAALESPFSSHDLAVVNYLTRASRVPYFPLVPLIQFWIRRKLGEDPQPHSPEFVAHRFRVPLLAISGSADPILPPESAQRLVDRVSAPKQIWVVDGAGHARCAEVAGEAYARRLADFYGGVMQRQ